MSRVSDSVEKVTTLDHDFVLQFEKWSSRAEEQTAQSTMSEADKRAFLKGFSAAWANSEAVVLRKQIDETEAEWCKETLALYGFAESRSGRIHVKDTHIIIEDEKVRTRFNDLLRQSREQHQKIKEMNAQLAKLQDAGLQSVGLSKKDIGLDEKQK